MAEHGFSAGYTDKTAEDAWTDTALNMAVRMGPSDLSTELCSMLLAHGADPKLGQPTALETAETYGNKDVANMLKAGFVEALVETGAALPTLPAAALAAMLHEAAYEGHLDVVKAAIASGADLDKRGVGGTANLRTPLMLAVLGGNKDVAKVLLEAGANVNMAEHGFSAGYTDKTAEHAWTDTALNMAVRMGPSDLSTELCSLLLAHGADPKLGQPTALETAETYGNKDVANMLKAGFVEALVETGVDAPVFWTCPAGTAREWRCDDGSWGPEYFFHCGSGAEYG